ncbi:DNA methyltransferase [Spirulina sp. CS-785/01]|uniref:DNA methyltransferase n=1 Tax=Spirulina sp. CS-785/01 TaxID=3021716 RepID=UPI00232C24A8|nr:DNA methyltransferase [Spirulina sp. CS-785/01]MDB9314754.1 DNA methyltransferase [Spirulina sp. CS-785/01]
MKAFERPIDQKKLDIVEKKRTNLLAWRGQFSPQLIEVLLDAYCLPDSVILDPFVGSGTVLLEAGNHNHQAYGFEINPAAYSLSKIYEFINYDNSQEILKQVRSIIEQKFPLQILIDPDSPVSNLADKIQTIRSSFSPEIQLIIDSLVILLDIANHKITNNFIQTQLANLAQKIETLPYSEYPIQVGLSDARCLPLQDNEIDFVITSPPYINVFNYHQNYRTSAELLGWNLLKIAKSEIGSNRANRKNRFYTVVQYCLDIAHTLWELSRVTKQNARLVFIVGYQSQVLGVPFYNADIIEKIGIKANLFSLALKQQRRFKNRFGKIIREDIINLVNLKNNQTKHEVLKIAQEVAFEVLSSNFSLVSSKNYILLANALDNLHHIHNTPLLENVSLLRSSELVQI